MNYKTTFIAIIVSVLTMACESDTQTKDISQPIVFDFAKSDAFFVPIFSDYPEGEEEFYQLDASHQDLPSPFEGGLGWKLTGSNHSDDLFMGIKAPITFLEANTLYKTSLEIEFLTNVPQNCLGIGGAPGESVYVKLAISQTEPSNELDNGLYRLNTDIGSQSQSGTEGHVVGNINNGLDCEEENAFSYTRQTLTTTQKIDVMSDQNGQIWIMAGTDSGFEGYTSIYITKLTVTISK